MAPPFFSDRWAGAVRTALAAGPAAQARAGKLQRYWDFFEQVKSGHTASWALWCRDLPPGLRESPACLFIQWGHGVPSHCQIAGPDGPDAATYTLGMGYADWKALHEGYDAQRTVMYRKILLEDGDLLAFFTTIYFFVECLAVMAAVPAEYPPAPARPAPGTGPQPRAS